jgi:hypothetical protein
MADVRKRTLDPRIAPRRIVRRHPYDELTDLDQHTAPPRFLGVRPLASDQLTVPPEQRVGRGDRGDLPQGRTADSVRSRGQPPAIVIDEPQPTLLPSGRRRRRFSSITGATACRCRRSSHPVSAISTIRTAAESITSRTFYHGWRERCPPTCGSTGMEQAARIDDIERAAYGFGAP